jgi:hypothetical protein
MATASFIQQVLHVLEKFQVSSLVGGNGYAMDIFLDSGFHNLTHRAVVAQVNDLCAFALQDTAHYIYSSIMAVKKRCSRNDADLIFWYIHMISKLSQK